VSKVASLNSFCEDNYKFISSPNYYERSRTKQLNEFKRLLKLTFS